VTTAPATRTPVLPGDTEASRSQRVITKHGCPHPVNHPSQPPQTSWSARTTTFPAPTRSNHTRCRLRHASRIGSSGESSDQTVTGSTGLPGEVTVKELHVGCAMWTHTAWQGRQLPHPLAAKDRLRAYASCATRWRGTPPSTPSPRWRRVRSWAAQTSPDFRFLLKLPKVITHERRLGDVAEPQRAFLAAIEPIGPRAHALWAQLPPAFGPTDLGALAAFLRHMPPEYRYAVEVRHRAVLRGATVRAAT